MSKTKPVVLAISLPKENWYELCKDYQDYFEIEQARWHEITVVSYPNSKPSVHLLPATDPINEKQARSRVIFPDLVIVRMLCRGISRLGENPDFRNVLYGFMHAGIPMINSPMAVLAENERPIMMGILNQVKNRLGKDKFPLIDQTYYSEPAELIFRPDFPFVLKVGYPHAGYGKLLITEKRELEDVQSLLHIHQDYVSAEPFIDSEYEVRVTFIAPDFYRAFKRMATGWKVNYRGATVREDIEVPEKYKMWVEEIRKEMPGLDSFSIDTIVDKSGKEYILEINGSSQGIAPEHKDAALVKLRELVMSRLNIKIEQEKETPKDEKSKKDKKDKKEEKSKKKKK